MEQRDAQAAELEIVEVRGRPAVGRERDGLAGRRPRRFEIGVFVVGEAVQVRAVRVHDEQVREPTVVPGEDELLAVGGPGRGREAAQRNGNAADLFVLRYV